MKKSDILRISLGVLFLFSGISKSLNPFGFSVKAMEYVAAIGIDAPAFFQPLLGIGIPALEIALGLFLLGKVMPKTTAVTLLAIISGFTVLTLWDLLASPVGDCGCFGDVVKLTPGESFAKNVVLLALSIWYFVVCEDNAGHSFAAEWQRMVTISLCSLLMPVLTYKHLPLYDVSGYTTGTVLYDYSEQFQSDSKGPLNLLYRNRFTDEVCSFSIEDNEWQDSTVWQFVGIQEENGSHGVSETVFPMLREDFTDVSRDVLSTSDSMLIVIVQDPSAVPDMTSTGIRTIAISAYDLSDCGVEHYGSDFSLLRQIMPNHIGGALLVHKGVIIGKWATCDCPYFEKR